MPGPRSHDQGRGVGIPGHMSRGIPGPMSEEERWVGIPGPMSREVVQYHVTVTT